MARLQELIAESGLSLRELSRLSGVSAGVISRLNEDRRTLENARARTVLKLARALETTVEDLLGVDPSFSDEEF